MLRTLQWIMMGLMVSPFAIADHGWREHHHHHHRHHEHHHYAPYPVYRERIIYSPPVVEYVPIQRHYYAPPPQPRYYGYDPRLATGLIGGVVGGAVGYELGNGDPLAAGFGAAAGAWLGNGSRY